MAGTIGGGEVNINLHIERLIVEDMEFDTRGKAQMSRAIKQQLLTQLTERGLLADIKGLADQRFVKGGEISFMDSDQPAATGQKIGEAIFRGIGNGD